MTEDMERRGAKRRIQAGLTALLLLGTLVPMGSPAGAVEKRYEVKLEGTVARTVTLVVTVQDSSGTPLSGATVALQEPWNSAVTGSNGQVDLTGIVYGAGMSYQIIVSKSGYVSKTVTYLCQEGETGERIGLTITLVKQSENDGGGNGGGGGGGSGGGNTGNGGGNNGSNGNNGSTGDEGSAGDGGSNGDNGSTGSDGSNGTTGDGGSNGSTGSTGSGGNGSNGSSGSTGSQGSGNGGTNSTGTTTKPGGILGDLWDKLTGGETTPEPIPPVEITGTPGTGSVQLPNMALEESAQSGGDLELIFPGEDGSSEKLVLPAFTDHDVALVDQGSLTAERTEAGYRLTLRIPQEPYAQSSSGLAHSLLSAVRDQGLELGVSFADDPELDFTMTAQELAALEERGCDLRLLYDRTEGAGYLVYDYQTAEHGQTDTAILPAAAFELAREKGLGLRCRIFDPETGEELWYEWIFAPADLQTMDSTQAVDLYIGSTAGRREPIRSLVQGVESQFLMMNTDGPLPVRAKLRVKNMQDFPADLAMALVRVTDDRLETLLEGLKPGSDGWYEWDMEDCTGPSALVQGLDLIIVLGREYESFEVSGFFGGLLDGSGLSGSTSQKLGWLLGLCLLLLLVLLILLIPLLVWKKRGEEGEEAIDTNWEVVNDDATR